MISGGQKTLHMELRCIDTMSETFI